MTAALLAAYILRAISPNGAASQQGQSTSSSMLQLSANQSCELQAGSSYAAAADVSCQAARYILVHSGDALIGNLLVLHQASLSPTCDHRPSLHGPGMLSARLHV